MLVPVSPASIYMKPILFGGGSLCRDGPPPFHGVLIGAERGGICTDQAGVAVAPGLQGLFFPVFHRHDDGRFSDDLLRGRGFDLGEVCWLGGWNFLSRECKRGAGADEQANVA